MAEIKAESYRLETPEGSWLGQVVITSDGFFGSVTDYGNFSFAWRSIGSQSFKEFILSLGQDYFASKLYQGLSYTDNGPRVRKACERFAQEILPALKKKLQEEMEIETAKQVKAERHNPDCDAEFLCQLPDCLDGGECNRDLRE